MRVLKIIEFSNSEFSGQPFNQIAVSDFLLILENGVTKHSGFALSLYDGG
jgi:hypothetical protein